MWCLIALVLLAPVSLAAYTLDDIEPDPVRRYHVRLLSGDILTGTVDDISDDGYTLRLRTAIGIATIYAKQIAEIIPMDEVYPHTHRLFFMPTAEPVRTNFYLGLYELLMPYGGVGIGDLFSFYGGRTVVPGIAADQQASVLNIKTTVHERRKKGDNLSLAYGGNIAWLNAGNELIHLYGVSTWSNERLAVTGMLFTKVYGEDEMTIEAGKYGSFDMRYSTGRIGLGLGIDMQIAQRTDLRFIGELWCSDLSQPDRSAALIGLRLWNTDVAVDFGLALFSRPAAAPVVNVVWTPRVRD